MFKNFHYLKEELMGENLQHSKTRANTSNLKQISPFPVCPIPTLSMATELQVGHSVCLPEDPDHA